jgi:hypothetical protein
MSAILHSIITSIENDRLMQLIDNMRFNKKHYEEYVENLHMHLDYEYDDEIDWLMISWDCEFDEQLNDLMNYEYYTYRPEVGKANFMWLEEFKELFNYQSGEKMYICVKCNCDGCFYAWKVEDERRCDMYLDEKGYINTSYIMYPFGIKCPKYSNEQVKIFIRPDCIYNDNIYDEK